MTDLTEFLLARIADDRERAERWHDLECDRPLRSMSDEVMAAVVPGAVRDCDCGGPARVLAECESKRRIIDAAWLDHERIEGEWGMCRSREQMTKANDYPDVVRLLALPYADRPDYREEWKP